MNGKKAKRIRKEVYGENSTKLKRRYFITETGTMTNLGLRRACQLAKKVSR
ncbi:MAG: hypothetical protein WC373_11640 [Smithella sp.]